MNESNFGNILREARERSGEDLMSVAASSAFVLIFWSLLRQGIFQICPRVAIRAI